LIVITTEICLMKSSISPNIVSFYDCFVLAHCQLWIVMEYMAGGSVTNVLNQYAAHPMSEPQMAYVLREVRKIYF
jgi:serine/threonine-protein kinase CLA4